MKDLLRSLFSPILNLFESGDEPYSYKSSHRKVLIAVGVLASVLTIALFLLALGQDIGYFLPVIVFGLVSLTSLVVGFLGTDRAVAKLWGSR